MSPTAAPLAERRAAPRRPGREVYIDAFRGLMALIMVQGHVFEALLSPESRAVGLYQVQLAFHGSTAPGFLFASGFVAGLPRAPLAAVAAVRRARRLLFVLLVGYALHLPFFSIWKTINESTPVEQAALFACDALQAIAVTQLFVLLLQWLLGRRWIPVAGVLSAVLIAAGPLVWGAPFVRTLPAPLAALFDGSTGSRFPLVPFAAFVLAGGVAGAVLGRQDEATRRRRAYAWGLGLIAVGVVLALLLQKQVDFWGPSPGYACIRLGGLVLLLRLVEVACHAWVPGMRALALLGHESLLVYVAHLYLVYGWLVGRPPLLDLLGRLDLWQASGVLLLMVPVLWTAAWTWHRAKARAPHEAALALQFVTVLFLYEFLTRPW